MNDNSLILKMTDYFNGDPKRIQHFLKVYSFAHHHTYSGVEGTDGQILIEADFLVNVYEDDLPENNIRNFRDKIFRTKNGIAMLNEMFGL